MEFLIGILLIVVMFILFPFKSCNLERWDGSDVMPGGNEDLKKVTVKRKKRRATSRDKTPKEIKPKKAKTKRKYVRRKKKD